MTKDNNARTKRIMDAISNFAFKTGVRVGWEELFDGLNEDAVEEVIERGLDAFDAVKSAEGGEP